MVASIGIGFLLQRFLARRNALDQRPPRATR
jgi:hypothetical protein